MSVLVIGDVLWRRMRDHLLADEQERAGFLLAKSAGSRLIVRDLVLIPDDQLERRIESVSVTPAALVDVTNRAVREDMVIIEAHSHPQSLESVRFSALDEQGQREMVAYLTDVMPGRTYGAIVVGQAAVAGRLWRGRQWTPLHHVLVTGSVVELWSGDGSPMALSSPASLQHSKRYDRQVRAFGQEGQSKLARCRAVVVGEGGIGSFVTMQLAHLGVRDVVLIDHDFVEESNLNRLVGATFADIGRLKVDLAEEQFRRVIPDASICLVPEEIRTESALEAAQSADVMFGCVDTDSGRLILNELAVTHAIPYIDCGVGIDAPEGHMCAAGGQVVVWVPGRPCLLCCGEIDRAIAAEEMESDDQRAIRREHGYISGADVPEPSVISLNGTVATLAVTEFLALLTGFRPTNHYTYYDTVTQRVGPRRIKRNPLCFTCSTEGIGDVADVNRYSRQSVPDNLPA